jgi:hypothetical protein
MSSIDWDDAIFLAALAAIFIGVWMEFSPGWGLIVLGAIVTIVSLANSYVKVWMERGC